jgi:hypothetical protein
VANRQLWATGLTVKEVKGLLRRSVLRPTAARGVYRVAGAARTWKQDLWVAVLAGPQSALASHQSAAAVHGLLAVPAVPHVTLPRGGQRPVRRRRRAPRSDRSRRPGPVRRNRSDDLARTIVDCAAVLGQGAVNGLVDAAFGKGLCSYPRVTEARRRAGPVRGGARLNAALAPYSGGAPPGSVKAAHVLRRIHEWGLPMPLCVPRSTPLGSRRRGPGRARSPRLSGRAGRSVRPAAVLHTPLPPAE